MAAFPPRLYVLRRVFATLHIVHRVSSPTGKLIDGIDGSWWSTIFHTGTCLGSNQMELEI